MNKKRKCWNCGQKYIGIRIICDRENCKVAWQYHIEEQKYHNKYGPIDSGARRIFLVEDLKEKK